MAGLVYIDAETWHYENAGTSTLLKNYGKRFNRFAYNQV